MTLTVTITVTLTVTLTVTGHDRTRARGLMMQNDRNVWHVIVARDRGMVGDCNLAAVLHFEHVTGT